jgi:MFS family permease
LSSRILVPGIPNVLDDFHSDDELNSTLIITIYVIGLAVGPLVLSPLSELYGRTPLMHITNFVFLASSILCAVSVNIPMMLIFRLMMGASSLSLGGGYVADMMKSEERSRAMNIWNLGPVLVGTMMDIQIATVDMILQAPTVGPMIGGYISLRTSWRWNFGLVSIIVSVFDAIQIHIASNLYKAALLTTACFVLLHESYPPRLLELKAKRLRKETANPLLHSKYDKGQTSSRLLYLSIIRPAKMLLRCPIIGIVSVFLGIAYSYMFLLFTTFTDVFEKTYQFNAGQAGLSYLGFGLGAFFGQYTLDLFMGLHITRLLAKNGKLQPEDQLPPLIAGSSLISFGLFWYGWSVEYKVHWIVPIIGSSFCGIGVSYTFLGSLTYLVDAFTLYAASALAANTVIRCIFGALIPLAGPPLYEVLGLGWGNTLLGFLSLLVVLASLWLTKYGERIRTNPKFQPDL